MLPSADIVDLGKPDVSLDDELHAADAALDSYIEAAPRAKPSAADFLKDSYLRLLAASRAQELQWLGVLEGRLGGVYEKRRQHVDGRIVRKSLAAVHQLHKLLFRRYARVAFRLHGRNLAHARRLEVENALLQIHDCGRLARVVAKIDQKFDALEDALERRCRFDDCYAANYSKSGAEDEGQDDFSSAGLRNENRPPLEGKRQTTNNQRRASHEERN